MEKFILAFLTIISFVNTAASKESAQLDTLETNTVLYKVTHPDFQYVSYLFGTHHALGKPFFDSLKQAEGALLASDLLIKENLNIPGHLAVDIINKRSVETKWKKFLDKEDHQFVLDLFSTSDLDFDKMTPAELFAFLGRWYKEEVCVGKETTANYFSLDDYIASKARENNIAVVGLETTEEQLRLINGDVAGMPRKVHKRRLSGMIARIKSESRELCWEIEWYRNMDYNFEFNHPCQNALVLLNRNDKWMIDLQAYLKTQNCFVVVGLSHLMFECGLISQLHNLGYTITSVPVK
ncbi:MAG: TraB/GumN family protein [Bacteroidetes bacterium]|nr:TraB/GumN family protein [Bacteroidota bacterium]